MQKEKEFTDKSEWEAAALKLLKGKPLSSLTKSALSGLTTEVMYSERPDAYDTVHRKKNTWGSVELQGRVAGRFQSDSSFTDGGGNGILRLYVEDAVPLTAERVEVVGMSVEQHIEMMQRNPAYVLHADPFALLLGHNAPHNLQASQTLMEEMIVQSQRKLHTHPFTIDASMVFDLGGSAKEELLWVLMSLVEYSKRGVDWSTIWVHCSTSASIMEMVVKFRTLRRLIKGLAQQLGHESQMPYICAETSIRTFSRADEHNNMLRALYASVGAVWGGVDGLIIHGYDVLTSATEHAHRISHNMHNVLKEESGLDKWLDPLFGSYQIEQQTEDFCALVWSEFASLEETGGLLTAIEGGFQQRLQTLNIQRRELIDTGSMSMTGVTVFANPMERLGTEWITAASDVFERDSARLEIVRARLEAFPAVNVQIKCFGTLVSYKARLEYIQQLLATVGLVGEVVSEFDASASICCIVGSSESYADELSSILSEKVHQPTWVVGQIPDALAAEFSVQMVYKGINTLRLWTELLRDVSLTDSSDGGER